MDYPEIMLRNGPCAVRVAPRRGALVTSIEVSGREILFLDRETFNDSAKNVRGGIPILFPFCGALPDNKFLPAGGTSIPQHGFARQREWGIARQSDSELLLEITDTEATRAVYPWPFRLTFQVRALPNGADIVMTAHNGDATPMPASPGWHPYFNLPSAKKAEFTTDVPGVGKGSVSDTAQINFGVPPAPSGEARMTLPGLGVVRLSHTPSMRHLQVWSLPGQPFVCVEPFEGPPNDINTPNAPAIPPGAERVWRMAITLESAA